MSDYGNYSATPLEDKVMEEIFNEEKQDDVSGTESHKHTIPSKLAKEAFIGIAGEVIQAIEPHSEADPIALLINFLTAFGSVIGDKPHFQVEADKHPCRLFAILVGETSKARKGTSWGHIRSIFGVIDELWKQNIQTGLSTGEGLIWAVRDEIKKTQPIREKGRTVGAEEVVIDSGISDKRLLIHQDEFSSALRVLEREGNTLSALVRRAWDTGDLQSLTKNNMTKATGAHISILGHITKDELLRYLTSTETANGFGNRFLWFCVKRSKALALGSGITEVNFTPLHQKIREAVDFAKQTDEIRWAEETKPIWVKIYPELSEGRQGLVGSMTARAEAYATRLACIYALLDLSRVVQQKHLLAALAIWDYAEASVRFIFQDRIGDPLANAIIDALKEKPEGIDRTGISNIFGKNKSSSQITESLNVLEGSGRIKKEMQSTNGRNREIYSLISLNSFNSYTNKQNYLDKAKEFLKNNKPQDYEKNEKNEYPKDK